MCMDLCNMGIIYGSHSMAYNYSLLKVSVYVGIIYIYDPERYAAYVILSVLSIFRRPFL